MNKRPYKSDDEVTSRLSLVEIENLIESSKVRELYAVSTNRLGDAELCRFVGLAMSVSE